MTAATRVMTHIEAHELLNADRGVHIVATTLDITYVGWFTGAAQGPKGWIRVLMEDFTGIPTTLWLQSRAHVHIEPFPQLHVGDLVVRRGFTDPDHANYHRMALGQVMQIRTDSDRRRVFLVKWRGELEDRWHTRRMLDPVDAEVLDALHAGGVR